MARLFAGSLLALLVLAGCTTYEKPPATSTPASSSSNDTGSGDGQRADLLASGENEHIRVRLNDHRVAGGVVTIYVDILNKDQAGVKRFGSALLAFEGTERTIYFDLAVNLAGGDDGQYQLDSNDNEGIGTRPWKDLTVYYREDSGGEFTDDEAVTIPLTGRGLPSKLG